MKPTDWGKSNDCQRYDNFERHGHPEASNWVCAVDTGGTPPASESRWTGSSRDGKRAGLGQRVGAGSSEDRRREPAEAGNGARTYSWIHGADGDFLITTGPDGRYRYLRIPLAAKAGDTVRWDIIKDHPMRTFINEEEIEMKGSDVLYEVKTVDGGTATVCYGDWINAKKLAPPFKGGDHVKLKGSALTFVVLNALDASNVKTLFGFTKQALVVVSNQGGEILAFSPELMERVS